MVSLWEVQEPRKADYGLWGTLPIGPYKTKATAPMETIVAGKVGGGGGTGGARGGLHHPACPPSCRPPQIWSFDQKFGILNVQVPSRMVVVKLSAASGGGLWVYNPIAATRELLEQVRALERQHGPVRHIVLGKGG